MANDEELCKHLVEQDDEHMDTDCEQPENDGCDSPTNVAVSVESVPMECSSIHDDSDEFSTALHQLKVFGLQKSQEVSEVLCNHTYNGLGMPLYASVSVGQAQTVRANVATHHIWYQLWMAH